MSSIDRPDDGASIDNENEWPVVRSGAAKPYLNQVKTTAFPQILTPPPPDRQSRHDWLNGQ
jgi:hypothetical protein